MRGRLRLATLTIIIIIIFMTIMIIRSVKSVIFVVNSLSIGQAGLLGVKLCQCLRILEQTSRESNQVISD